MEDITAKAVPQLNKNEKPESMENDWIVNFFDKSRIVSDNEMQQLWSRILAGEANAHGTYSKLMMLCSLQRSKTADRSLWESKIELGKKFFDEIKS